MSIASSYVSGSIGGSTGARGDVKFKYLGFTQTKNNDALITQETYQGTKEQLTYRRDNNSTWAIGYQHDTYGRLQTVVINQDAGPFWVATINYNKPLNNGITITSNANSPQQTNLDVSMFSMPIEKNLHYDYRWDHFLFCTNMNVMTEYLLSKDLPWLIVDEETGDITYSDDFWDTQITTEMADQIVTDCSNGKFNPLLDVMWAIDLNERPKEPRNAWNVNDETHRVISLSACQWAVYYKAKKPGVSYFDLPTYTITETGKYTSKTNCRWALQRGGMLAFPVSGDFGIQKYYHPGVAAGSLTAGYWLCQGANIDFDGKYYNCSCRYTWSPDPYGWDLQMYSFYKSWNEYRSKSSANPNPILTTGNSGNNAIFNRTTPLPNINNPILP